VLPAVIECATCCLRPWRHTDKASLLVHADNPRIARNLRNIFPYPYTADDADRWLAVAAADPWPAGIWTIEVDGEAAGSIGLHRLADVECRSAEIGYWLGEAHWGRGIVSEAVGRVTELALSEPDLVRVFAPVFAWNVASMRVLERNGYTREAVLQRAGFKDGAVFDLVIYARTRESPDPYVPAKADGPLRSDRR
jgi:RimJ/RimL family protein N-acetyltransferase